MFRLPWIIKIHSSSRVEDYVNSHDSSTLGGIQTEGKVWPNYIKNNMKNKTKKGKKGKRTDSMTEENYGSLQNTAKNHNQ